MKEFWQKKLEIAEEVRQLTKEGALAKLERITEHSHLYNIDELSSNLKIIAAALDSAAKDVQFSEDQLRGIIAEEQKAE